jgi:hypothetical protein
MTSHDERRAKALELHLAGATYDAIANAVGYASRSGAHKAVQEALLDLGRPVQGTAIDTELARLDAMLTGLWPKARRGDVQAVDRVLKISERRSVLLAGAAVPKQEEQPRGKLASVSNIPRPSAG